MKKRTTRLCSALLSVLMLLSATTVLQVNATEVKEETIASTKMFGTGDLSKQMEDTYDGVVIGSAEDYYALRSNGVTHNLIKNSKSLPASVDHSQSKYFPEIGNQGGMGSCVCWAQTYYQFTYAMNKAMGVTTTPQNSFSPIFTYSLVCSAQADLGSGHNDVATLMKEIGAATVKSVPITDDCTNWYANEDIRREALKYRVKDYQMFEDIGSSEASITSPDDEDLVAIKTSLANGDVLTFSTEIYSWVSEKLTKNPNAPENDKFFNEYVIVKQIGAQGAHRMTIVGYNDNIWTDINKNNQVDAGEMGALKIANSWGEGYCNNGFVWLAYDALNEKSCVEGGDVSASRRKTVSSVLRIDVRPYDTTKTYFKLTITTSDRTTVSPYLIAEKDGTIYKTFLFAKTSLGTTNEKTFAFDGSQNVTTGTFLFPLDGLIDEIESDSITDYTWRVNVVDKKDDDRTHTIQDAYIYDESTNKGYYPASGTFPITIDYNEATIDITESKLNHAAVYYRGYDKPILNYKLNGSWHTVDMEENIEREGYLHKYVIDLGTSNQATLYFTDENGRVDNNKGSYYKAYKGVNYYATENARDSLSVDIGLFTEDKFLDVDTGHQFKATATGGYEPYQYQFVTENLVTGETSTGYWGSSNTSVYYPRNAGDYRTTVTVEDYSGKTATKTYNYTVVNRPFAIEKAELKSSPNALTGKEVVITGNTVCEGMQYVGYLKNTYEIEISKNGKIYHTDSVKATSFSMPNRTANFEFKWTPSEAGYYTVKVSADDKAGEYSEVNLNLTVNDINGTIIGDADNDGSVKIIDATLIQKYCVESVADADIWSDLADTDKDEIVSIKDATNVQLYLAGGSNKGNVGQTNYWEPEPTTEPTTVAPTTVQPTTVAQKNIVTFTNSLNWSGTIKCYYWSNSNTNMTTWPGKAMTYLTTNDYGQKQYTFEVPKDATYIIFTDGSSQTVDIPYSGGEVRYYAKTTMSNGAYEVGTW